jgi:hypothetical protein
LLRRVCLSVRVNQLGSQWTDFHEIWYLIIFSKKCQLIQVSFKSDKNSGDFTWRSLYINGNISLNASSNEKYFGQNLCRKSKHYFQWLFFFENRALDKIMW